MDPKKKAEMEKTKKAKNEKRKEKKNAKKAAKAAQKQKKQRKDRIKRMIHWPLIKTCLLDTTQVLSLYNFVCLELSCEL